MSFNSEISVIAVPYWMMSIVRRHSKTPNVFLDFGTLQKIFSFEDLATLTHLNNNDLGDLIGTNTNLARVWGSYFWNDEFPDNRDALTAEDRDKIELLTSVASNDPQYDTVLKDRIFCVEQYDQFNKPYEVYDIGRNVVVAILYPGYFSGKSYQHTRNQEQNTNLFNLIRELIQKTSVYTPFSECAKTTLFSTYLNILNTLK